MSKTDQINTDSVRLIAESLNGLLVAQKKANKISKKQKRIDEKQYRQSLLDFEQSERQYLIEKSNLQPTFRLSATEVLVCEPDFVNDPEQASEASFLLKKDVLVDQRVLRLQLGVKGHADYMHPSLVYSIASEENPNGLAYAFSEHTYFVPIKELGNSNKVNSLTIYFIYKDKTTLPVIHKYHLNKDMTSSLQRWSVSQVNTVYATTADMQSVFVTAHACEALFLIKE